MCIALFFFFSFYILLHTVPSIFLLRFASVMAWLVGYSHVKDGIILQHCFIFALLSTIYFLSISLSLSLILSLVFNNNNIAFCILIVFGILSLLLQYLYTICLLFIGFCVSLFRFSFVLSISLFFPLLTPFILARTLTTMVFLSVYKRTKRYVSTVQNKRTNPETRLDSQSVCIFLYCHDHFHYRYFSQDFSTLSPVDINAHLTFSAQTFSNQIHIIARKIHFDLLLCVKQKKKDFVTMAINKKYTQTYTHTPEN